MITLNFGDVIRPLARLVMLFRVRMAANHQSTESREVEPRVTLHNKILCVSWCCRIGGEQVGNVYPNRHCSRRQPELAETTRMTCTKKVNVRLGAWVFLAPRRD